MHILNIVILAHSSLLSSGIASKLTEYKELLAVQTLDIRGADYLSALKNELPEIIIVDAGDSNLSQETTIVQLLEAAPNAKVISLNLSNDLVKVFSRIERKVDGANDLVGLIKTFSGGDRA
ncbi:MAG TPA: hypothetical protein VLZ89_12615 [Anaerolineales bacterium]|nr:hypothetical protein [Anaerolineales bacterium]